MNSRDFASVQKVKCNVCRRALIPRTDGTYPPHWDKRETVNKPCANSEKPIPGYRKA